MSSEGASIGWRKLREFAGVDLGKSFVLSWKYDFSALNIDVDLLLTPEHPFYEKPRPAEKVCIRAATIEFPQCVAIDVEGKTSQQGLDSVARGIDTGAIEDLRRMDEGPYILIGTFGQVTIDADRPVLRLQRR